MGLLHRFLSLYYFYVLSFMLLAPLPYFISYLLSAVLFKRVAPCESGPVKTGFLTTSSKPVFTVKKQGFALGYSKTV